ncbi:hypothetical protein EDB84DRAFT_1444898 [Lactarius hengduanensis]|nr:hypothetical protein EDB84DRAFT_1444898 [Lactarius hengduanensis]
MAQPQLCPGQVVITAALWLGLPVEIFTSFGVKAKSDNIGISGGKGAVEGLVYDPIHDWIASICADLTQLWRIKGSILAPVLSLPFEYEGYGKCVQFCNNGQVLSCTI